MFASYIGPQFRLANRTGNAGRVEMSIDGVWGTIVMQSYSLTDTTASVICKKMNFAGGYASPSGYYGRGRGKIWMFPRSCSASIGSIFDCSINFVDDIPPNYQHSYDIGVSCYPNSKKNCSCHLNMYLFKYTYVLHSANVA